MDPSIDVDSGQPPSGMWFPRPRGAAPHGPGGVPKRWSNALGVWETAEGDHGAVRQSQIFSKPRGTVSDLRPLSRKNALC